MSALAIDVSAAQGGWTKAVVRYKNAAPSSAAVSQLNAQFIKAYDSFAVVAIPDDDKSAVLDQARRQGLSIDLRPEWDIASMPGWTVDVRSPKLPSTGVLERYPSDGGLYVMQFDGPLFRTYSKP